MRKLFAITAALLLAGAASAEVYDIYERAADADGTVTSQTMIAQFVTGPAPQPTLGGHLLALDNQTGRQHLAVPHGAPAPVIEQPPQN